MATLIFQTHILACGKATLGGAAIFSRARPPTNEKHSLLPYGFPALSLGERVSGDRLSPAVPDG